MKVLLHALGGALAAEFDLETPLPEALALDEPGNFRVFDRALPQGLKAKLRGADAAHYFEDATPRAVKANSEGAIITERQLTA